MGEVEIPEAIDPADVGVWDREVDVVCVPI